jgi:hypothetical protein
MRLRHRARCMRRRGRRVPSPSLCRRHRGTRGASRRGVAAASTLSAGLSGRSPPTQYAHPRPRIECGRADDAVGRRTRHGHAGRGQLRRATAPYRGGAARTRRLSQSSCGRRDGVVAVAAHEGVLRAGPSAQGGGRMGGRRPSRIPWTAPQTCKREYNMCTLLSSLISSRSRACFGLGV